MISEAEEVAVVEEVVGEEAGVVVVAFAMKAHRRKLLKLVWSHMIVNLSCWYDRVCQTRFLISMPAFTWKTKRRSVRWTRF